MLERSVHKQQIDITTVEVSVYLNNKLISLQERSVHKQADTAAVDVCI